MTSVAVETRWRVAEVFGPTVQGEGALAGLPTYFVRFGGCDFRCSWCDSLHSVLPSHVSKLPRLSAGDILHAIGDLDPGPEWVTLSGGNPALFDLGPLVDLMDERDLKVMVETQGSEWKDWLGNVDLLTVSPKPPSSGMATPEHLMQLGHFMDKVEMSYASGADRVALKMVVFDEADYEFARRVARRYDYPAFVSVGTERPPLSLPGTEPETIEETRAQVCDSYRWLAERVASDPLMSHVRVLPQLHVLAFGHQLGV